MIQFIFSSSDIVDSSMVCEFSFIRAPKVPVCDVAPDNYFLLIQTDPGYPKTAVGNPLANPATLCQYNQLYTSEVSILL